MGPLVLRERLGALPPAAARALRFLFGGPRAARVERDGEVSQWSPVMRNAPASAGWWICSGTGHTVAIALHEDGWTDDIGARHWTDYSGDSRVLAWGLAHDSLLAHLGELLGEELAVHREATSRPPHIRSASLDLDVSTGRARACLRLSLASETLDALVRSASWERAGSAGPVDAAQVPVPMRIALPQVDLPARELAATRPGDLLMLGQSPGIWQRLHLALDDAPATPVASARRVAAGLEVTGWLYGKTVINPGEVAMSDTDDPSSGQPAEGQGTEQEGQAHESPASDEASQGDSLDLPVTLAVELGRVEVPYSELAAMQPGYVIELANSIDSVGVRLYANGRAIGRGELVSVGDNVGVRVLEIARDGSGDT